VARQSRRMPGLATSDPRLVRRPLEWDLAPAEALQLVRDEAHPVALIGNWADGSDVIGSEPVLVREPPRCLDDVLDSPWPPAARTGHGLDGVLDSPWPAGVGAGHGLPGGPGRGPDLRRAEAHPGFGGGWIGYLGFSAAGNVGQPAGLRRLPAWWFGYYDHMAVREQATGRWFFEALWTAERDEALERRFADLSRRGCGPPRRAHGYSCGDFRLRPAAGWHKSAVGRAVEYIWQGDIFQANICLRAEADFRGQPLDAFCRAVTALRPPYAAFLRLPGGAVASLSPELFLRRTGRTVVSRPVKGTSRRSPGPEQATRQRTGLERSAKNRAENVMITDLVRNDLSRVCAAGSVTVPRLLAAEPHPGVWHLVSEVRGTLRRGCGDGDLIRATFPPGSVTGAPKVRALEIIDELEAAPREVYTGAIGYRSPVAGLELNVAIRTFEFAGGRVWLGAGGGIVADSAQDDEYAECLHKAGPLIRAIGARLDDEPAGPPPAAEAADTARSLLRPRPAAGVFTSLRVTAGQAAGLAGHLARLDDSTRRLYGKPLPASLAGDLADCLSGRPSGRLRITVRPVGGPLRAAVEVVPAGRHPAAVRLRPAVIPGGLGAHKWADRRLLADLAAVAGVRPGEQLLITDTGGDVLETDRASVFAVSGGILRTPAADGRILPGITRDAILDAARRDGIKALIGPVSMDLVLAADEVFVCNAVHGVLPVRSVAGQRVSWDPGPVARHMAAVLADRPASPDVADGHARRQATPYATTGPGEEPDLGHGVAGAANARPRRVLDCAPAHVPRMRSPERCGKRSGPLIVLIDNYDSFTYNLAHMLAAGGCRVEVVRNDEVTAEQIAGSGPAGVVISPGPCGPRDAGISIDVVRACAPATTMLGICLGHQVIAAAFGAVIIRAPRPVHGMVSEIRHDGRGVLAGLPQPFRATRYHSLVVDEDTLPTSLKITARSGRIPMGLRHATHPIEGVQFHPESILTTHGEKIIRNFAERASSASGDAEACRADRERT
jgi:para-aminobenzoate synthetase / 4-amino-4-deoxychorismate lyase